MSQKFSVLGLGIFFLFVGQVCFASFEYYPLSVSGGIAMPSYSTSLFQNPAAVVETPKWNVLAQGAANTSFEDRQGIGGVQYGNGMMGAGAGVRLVPNSDPSRNAAYYGLGVAVNSANLSLGISGSTILSGSNPTAINLGMLWGLTGPLRFGLTSFNINSSTPEWGSGVAFTVNSVTKMVLDVTANSSFKHLNAKPGLLVGSSEAALTISYGMGEYDSNQIRTGFSAGGSVQLSRSFGLEIYYNQIAPIYGGLTVRL